MQSSFSYGGSNHSLVQEVLLMGTSLFLGGGIKTLKDQAEKDPANIFGWFSSRLESQY